MILAHETLDSRAINKKNDGKNRKNKKNATMLWPECKPVPVRIQYVNKSISRKTKMKIK